MRLSTRAGRRRDVQGRVVAITGGAQGIGAAIGRTVSGAGAKVAIGDIDADAAERTAAALGSGHLGYGLDVADRASVDAFLLAVEAQLGPVDVLVNNAGVMWVGPFDEEPERARRRMIDVNLIGVINGIQSVLPGMIDRGVGHVVTIASAASKVPSLGEATYTATKHAVYGYCATVRAELRASGADGVDLSVVMPVVVDTELAVGTDHGGGRRLQPDDVAAAVVQVLREPKFDVFVPGAMTVMTRLLAVLPQRGRDAMVAKLVPNQAKVTDQAARARYEARALGR